MPREPSDAKRIVLARRARFVSAALVGIAGCAPAPERPATGPRRDDLVIPSIPVSATGHEDAAAIPVADADGDGIADDEDTCPDRPGKASEDRSKHGCPQMIVSVCLSIILPPKVGFPPNGTQPALSSSTTLDEAAKVLKQQPQLQLEIEGHTDSLEPAPLGQSRADAVRAELVKRGIAMGRITTTNAGSTKPLEPNVTVAGRTKNRRVEFHVH